MLAGLPFFGCECLKPLKISTIRIIRGINIFLHQLIQVIGEDRADRVNGVVTAESFGLKARECVQHHFFTKCQLVLHDDVDDRVKLSVR